MRVTKTDIPGVLLIAPARLSDDRGFFVETFHVSRYMQVGLTDPFVQDNWSRSSRGTLRGLHLQHPNSQGKLVGVTRGEVFDVALDARMGSPTFGRHICIALSDANGLQLFVPRGVAHGFQAVSETADLVYKCDNHYSPADEIAIRWDDPKLGIKWPLANPILSSRDAVALPLSEARHLPRFEA